jgi:8-oxo-dGTP pyrophosphatase MutT (NUDIX family)
MSQAVGLENITMRRIAQSPARSHDYPIVAVGGVVYRRTRRGQLQLLLIKKRAGFWTLPKGRVLPGEPLADAVAREVSEETGLSGAVETTVRQVSYEIQKKGSSQRKVVTYYLLRANGGVLRPDKTEQIEKVRWFPIPAALRRIGRRRIRAVAEHAARLLEPVVHAGVRVHE